MDSGSSWKEAGQLTASDELEIEPGRGSEISSIEPAPESGGRQMVQIEMMPPGNFCVFTLPATMPVKVRA